MATTPLPEARPNLRRRFAIVSTVALAVLGASLGVSFLGDTGTTDVSVTAASTDFVFPVAASGTLPNLGLAAAPYTTALKYTEATAITGNGTTTAFEASGIKVPTWAPVTGSAGSVTTAGDVAVFDATEATMADHSTLRVNMYVTNLPGLQQAYSSFAFPVNIYRCASACDTNGDWEQASPPLSSVTYLTNTDGFLSFSLPAGYYYDLTLDTGGSFYTISTSTAANLNPKFYFTALPI